MTAEGKVPQVQPAKDLNSLSAIKRQPPIVYLRNARRANPSDYLDYKTLAPSRPLTSAAPLSPPPPPPPRPPCAPVRLLKRFPGWLIPSASSGRDAGIPAERARSSPLFSFRLFPPPPPSPAPRRRNTLATSPILIQSHDFLVEEIPPVEMASPDIPRQPPFPHRHTSHLAPDTCPPSCVFNSDLRAASAGLPLGDKI